MSWRIACDVIRAGRRWLVASLALGVTMLSCAGAGPAGHAIPAATRSALLAGSAAPGLQASLAPGTIETVAGGVGGPGPARSVGIGGPCALSFAAGNLYVAQGGLVRRVSMRTGWLTTLIGADHVSGPGPDAGPARDAGFSWSCGLATDHSGNLLVGDGAYWDDGSPAPGDNLVRVVATSSGTFYGQPMLAGHVYTIGGDGEAGYSGDGGPALQAELSAPGGVAVDPAGNVVFADAGNDRIRVIAVTTGTFYGQAMTAGDIYTVAGDGTDGFSGDGGPATTAHLTITPSGDGKIDLSETWPVVAVDLAVRLVAARTGRFFGQAMRAGDIYTIAGDGCCTDPGTSGVRATSTIVEPTGVSADAAGNVVIADPQTSQVRVVTATSGTFYGQAMKAGRIYTIAGDGQRGDSGNGGPALQASVSSWSVNVDAAGNVLIAGYSQIRVVAARTGHFYGQDMTAGHIYTVAGGGTGSLGDGGPAVMAELSDPIGVAVTKSGALYINDTSRIRVVVAG